jgi:hypothetical protein
MNRQSKTQGYTLDLTPYAIRRAVSKGFKAPQIKACFDDPVEAYPSKSHPGSFRVRGHGLCLCGYPEGTVFKVVTMFEDGVITPPRPDQLSTPEGRAYAARYLAGHAATKERQEQVA